MCLLLLTQCVTFTVAVTSIIKMSECSTMYKSWYVRWDCTNVKSMKTWWILHGSTCLIGRQFRTPIAFTVWWWSRHLLRRETHDIDVFRLVHGINGITYTAIILIASTRWLRLDYKPASRMLNLSCQSYTSLSSECDKLYPKYWHLICQPYQPSICFKITNPNIVIRFLIRRHQDCSI